MTAGDLATLLVSLVTFAAFVVLLVAVLSVLRTLRELRRTLDHLRAEALPAVAELRDTAVEAGLEVERIDELLTTAESIAATVEGASRLGYLAFRRPMIGLIALLRGIGRGLWRLVGGTRGRRGGRPRSTSHPRQPPGPPADLRDRRRGRGRAA
ncbi:MAG: hypothetical protein HYX32_12600 [Actinobacteria bacterium]|nr:hypothetical protein [Actinomycetota bacterium]